MAITPTADGYPTMIERPAIPPRLAQVIAAMDDEIASLVADRDELLAPYQALVVAGQVKQNVDAIMPRGVRNGGHRPERARADGQVEYLYGHGGYTCAADALRLGTVDLGGRWLTIPEWKLVRKEDHRRRAASRDRGNKLAPKFVPVPE